MEPTDSGFFIQYDAQVRVCKCTPDNDIILKSDFRLAEIVVDGDIGYFHRNDYWRAYGR